MSTKHSTTKGQHKFAEIPRADIQRSSFDRSCGLKTTFDSGYLVPIFCDEALPGDTFNLSASIFARLATPLHPILDNLFMDTFYFSVPVRLLWDNWQRFNGEEPSPGDSTDFLVPTIDQGVGGAVNSSLSDYLGIPTEVDDLVHSALWHRAYNLIFSEWFRDQNMVDAPILNTGDGPDDPADYELLRRGKRHDYFTSCLPWPQKGPTVGIPIGGSAPVTLYGPTQYKAASEIVAGQPPTFDSVAGSGLELERNAGSTAVTWDASYGGAGESVHWDDPNLQVNLGGATGLADLGAATTITINALREAFQLQKLYERNARGGTRYTEILKTHFGVTSPDARVQRPEYLGGNTTTVNVNPVAQTSATDAGTPLAELAAYGVATSNGHGFVKSFVEHSIIIGLVSVRADLNYQQGLPRMFSRSTRYDFYWPALAHIGEQAVLQKEIFADGIPANDDLVFGYQERFAEYRYKPSMITGQMRSNYAQTLDTWHLAQDFATAPTLSEDFIEEDPPIARIVAVPTEPDFLFDAYFKFKCVRPMPVYSVPGLIDHF